jgi:hypothetical protein
MVGEASSELALRPYGTQVMPHGTAKARARAEGDGQPPQMIFYAPVHIHPHTADLYQEISAAVGQMGRY